VTYLLLNAAPALHSVKDLHMQGKGANSLTLYLLLTYYGLVSSKYSTTTFLYQEFISRNVLISSRNVLIDSTV